MSSLNSFTVVYVVQILNDQAMVMAIYSAERKTLKAGWGSPHSLLPQQDYLIILKSWLRNVVIVYVTISQHLEITLEEMKHWRFVYILVAAGQQIQQEGTVETQSTSLYVDSHSNLGMRVTPSF